MKEIINKIIEIETRAQKLIDDAKKEQSEISQNVDIALEEKKKEYAKKANEQIEYIKKEETRSADERLTAMKKDHEEKLDKLKKLTESHIAELVNKVYENIIRPTDLTV